MKKAKPSPVDVLKSFQPHPNVTEAKIDKAVDDIGSNRTAAARS
jgi:hypothetical protein